MQSADSNHHGINSPTQMPVYPHDGALGNSKDATLTLSGDVARVRNSKDATLTLSGDVARLPGVGDAMPHQALLEALTSTNGLRRELLLTAYLPPSPAQHRLGGRLLELYLGALSV